MYQRFLGCRPWVPTVSQSVGSRGHQETRAAHIWGVGEIHDGRVPPSPYVALPNSARSDPNPSHPIRTHASFDCMKHNETHREPAPLADSMSPDDIARRWDCSPQLVYRLIDKGRLPAMNIGASTRRATWRIKRSDLLEYERQISTPRG